ncbi:hypothetical protein Y032_0700g1640 [Ancylostoma ceylanicum]|uniref:Uncharacterized protein n=1 Tax=Ancylostoma ceylanicum TaxID=53326 RepID=A0A016WGH6_9BILA|nr:hypothetical protein Y032_0700g1640 [Ancylostoma ceylanicum]
MTKQKSKKRGTNCVVCSIDVPVGTGSSTSRSNFKLLQRMRERIHCVLPFLLQRQPLWTLVSDVSTFGEYTTRA